MYYSVYYTPNSLPDGIDFSCSDTFTSLYSYTYTHQKTSKSSFLQKQTETKWKDTNSKKKLLFLRRVSFTFWLILFRALTDLIW